MLAQNSCSRCVKIGKKLSCGGYVNIGMNKCRRRSILWWITSISMKLSSYGCVSISMKLYSYGCASINMKLSSYGCASIGMILSSYGCASMILSFGDYLHETCVMDMLEILTQVLFTNLRFFAQLPH